MRGFVCFASILGVLLLAACSSSYKTNGTVNINPLPLSSSGLNGDFTQYVWAHGQMTPNAWDLDKYANQTSSPIWLEERQRYYIKALHKDATGANHLEGYNAVRASLPRDYQPPFQDGESEPDPDEEIFNGNFEKPASIGAQVQKLLRRSIAEGKEIYISPQVRKSGTGESSDHAAALAELPSLLRNQNGSVVVRLAPGTYFLNQTLNLHAPKGEVLHLKGVQGVVFESDFDFQDPAESGSGIRLQSGRIIVENIHFRHTRTCFRTDRRYSINDVYLKNVSAENVHSCILVDRDSIHPVQGWTVRGLFIKGYYRTGIRLAGPKTGRIELTNLQIDGAHGYSDNDCYKGGIQLLAGVSQIWINNALIENNIGDCEGFQQGDGVEADDKGGVPKDITLQNIYVANSGDANLDLKARKVSLFNVESVGGELTHYSYKFWNYQDYLCVNCTGTNPQWAQILLAGADAVFKNPKFSAQKDIPVCDIRESGKQGAGIVSFFNTFENSEPRLLGCDGPK